MALRLGALHDALQGAVDGTITDEQARLAAEEVAGYESRLSIIERDLLVLKWMVGTNIALTLFVLGRLFTQ